MSIRVQVGPPGSLGMGHYGIGGASPPHMQQIPIQGQQLYPNSPPPPGQNFVQYQQQPPVAYNQYGQQQVQYQSQPGFPPQQIGGAGYGDPMRPHIQQPQPQQPQQQWAPQPVMQQQPPVTFHQAPQPQSSPLQASPPSIPAPIELGVIQGTDHSPQTNEPHDDGSSQPAVKVHLAGMHKIHPNSAASNAWGQTVNLARINSAAVVQPETKVMAKIKALEDLAPDSPTVKWVIFLLVLIVDMFKLSMASMLSVFVPQLCAADIPGDCSSQDIFIRKNPHDCSFVENFTCLTSFNKNVLAWNFICLITLVGHYVLVWKREKYMIAHLKETLVVGRLALKGVIHEYPTIQLKLHHFNRAVFNMSLVILVFQLINIICSGYLVFALYNNGYKTATTFVTNIILIGIVLYTCLSAAYIGLKHELAYSCIGFEPVSYNAIRPHNQKHK